MHGLSHPDASYATPDDVSGLLTPDLDLPLDFGAFDDFPVTDTLQGFAPPPHSAVPVPISHTHHYPPQQQQQFQQHQHPPMQLPHAHGNS